MKHVGDITKLSGHTLPPADVIIGGSPCQDLSIAGKGAGLAGNRSGLFMEQLRIVKELRDEDRKRGRTGVSVRPRFMVWENVPGAFSSNRGRDFQVVLQETIRIAEPNAPDIPRPKKWPLADAYFGDGWSVAYRVFDAQFWGVPQRRRRICLIADFGGRAAPEILFVRESLSWDTTEGGTPGKETSPGTGGGAYPSVARSLTARYDGSPCVDREPNIVAQGFGETGIGYWASGIQTLRVSGDRPGSPTNVVVIPICDKATRYQGGGPTRNGDGSGNGLGVGHDGDPCPALSTADRHAVFAVHQNQAGEVRIGETAYTLNTNSNATGRNSPLCYDARGNGDGETVCTLTGDHANRVTDYTPLVARSLTANCYKQKGREDAETYLPTGGIVRRLTPLERERLQGFPSEKKVDLSAMTKDEYIAWNISVGNIVVDAESGKVFATRGPGGIALKEPKELKGSVVNGYRTVNIRNGTTKLQCRVHRIVWVSRNGVIPDGYCIDHINNDKQDNRIANLQLLTPAENSTKAAKDGLYKTGEDNAATKLSPDLYDEIAFLYHCSDVTLKDLAEIYGVSKSRIHQIVKEIGYTDIGDWTNDNGKAHKTSDSARCKALGNSIALPPWKWVLKRISAQYERDATLGSLFDGIGGFPLIWEQINGKGSCVWASEIEEFCIAVTRKRFG